MVARLVPIFDGAQATSPKKFAIMNHDVLWFYVKSYTGVVTTSAAQKRGNAMGRVLIVYWVRKTGCLRNQQRAPSISISERANVATQIRIEI